MYYRLKPMIRLRGWKLLPYALVNSSSGEARFIDKAMFDVAELCNGLVDFDLPFISDAVRRNLSRLVEAGIVEVCRNGKTIKEEQKYCRYDNR